MLQYNYFFIALSCGLLIIVFKYRPKFLFYALIGVVILDFWFYVRPTIRTVSENEIRNWTDKSWWVTRAIGDFNFQRERIYIDKSAYISPRVKKYGLANENEEIEWQFMILRPNLGMMNGVAYADGYGSMVDSKYQKYFSENIIDPTGIYIKEDQINKIDVLNTKYILARSDDKKFQLNANYTPQITHGILTLYLNKRAYPRVYIKNDNGQTDKIKSVNISPNKINVELEVYKEAEFMISGNFDSNWRAYINNVETKMIISNPSGILINVRPGQQNIELIYKPISVIYGLWLSILGVIVLVYEIYKIKK